MNKCNTCNGTYEPIGADGLQYFHVCPPLSVLELTAAVAAAKVVLPGGETPDIAVTRRSYERATKRDENVKSTAPKDAGTMKAIGTGVTVVASGPAPIVVVP